MAYGHSVRPQIADVCALQSQVTRATPSQRRCQKSSVRVRSRPGTSLQEAARTAANPVCARLERRRERALVCAGRPTSPTTCAS